MVARDRRPEARHRHPGHPAGRRGARRPEARDGPGRGARGRREPPRRRPADHRGRRSGGRGAAILAEMAGGTAGGVTARLGYRPTARFSRSDAMADLKIAIAGAGGRMGAANIRAIAATRRASSSAPPSTAIGAPAIGKDAGEQAGIEALGVTDHRRHRRGARRRRGASSISPRRRRALALAKKAAERGLVHIIGTTGCQRGGRRGDPRRPRRPARASSRPAISRSGVNLLAGPREAGGGGAARLRHRDPRNAPQQEGRCALGHGADARRGGGARAATSSSRTQSVRVRDGHTGAARGRRHRLCDAARRQRHRRAHGDLRRPERAASSSPTSPTTARCSPQGAVRAALWAARPEAGLYSMADVLGFNS